MTSYDPNQYPSDGYPGQPYPQDQGYQGQPYPQGQAYQGQPLYPMMQNTEKNNLGNWAVGLGVASVLCCGIFTGIPAAILGYLGLQACNEGRASNKGVAITGIVLGGLSIVAMIAAYALGMYDSILS